VTKDVTVDVTMGEPDSTDEIDMAGLTAEQVGLVVSGALLTLREAADETKAPAFTYGLIDDLAIAFGVSIERPPTRST